MKKLSWEIVLAGFLFIAIAIYLSGKPSGNDYDDHTDAAPAPTAPTPPDKPSPVHVIDLENLSELSALAELEKISELEDLEKLKTLAHLIPNEVRDEFLTEVDVALKELSDSKIEISFDQDDKIIVINTSYDEASKGVWSNTSPGIYTYVNELDVSNITSTAISLPQGSVKIVGSSEETAKFTIQASGKIKSIEELNSHIQGIAKVNDREAIFSMEYLDGEPIENIQIQATLYIPETIPLVVNSGGGHIEATNIHADQTYETGGGHIKLNKLKGEVIAVSGGGHISVIEADGDVTLKTSGGHLVLKNCSGDATLKTDGGNIDVKEVAGEIMASTNGGNVQLIYNRPITNDATLETSAGNVLVWMPKSSQASVMLEASSAVELKGFIVNGEVSKTKAKGTINDGGAEIIGFSKYGKVTLAGNDN
ncbi:MAG: hypothetical protein ED557_06940 [Balneola sp.]|nr:MAG: hypothetical protein ED557_06940 [Balneola sp.]